MLHSNEPPREVLSQRDISIVLPIASAESEINFFIAVVKKI